MLNKNEFSRVIEINDSIIEKQFKIEATPQELKALSKRFDIENIKFLKSDYIITPKTDIFGAYVLTQHINSIVTKFTIDGMEENIVIDNKFDTVLLNESMARNNYEQLKDFDIEIWDENNQVDIGEIAAQYLSLCVFM